MFLGLWQTKLDLITQMHIIKSVQVHSGRNLDILPEDLPYGIQIGRRLLTYRHCGQAMVAFRPFLKPGFSSFHSIERKDQNQTYPFPTQCSPLL